MRKLLRWFARKAGVSTWYHVSATYQQDSHIGMVVMSLTCDVTPWIHEDNYSHVLEFVKSQATRPATMPSIISITRL